MNLYIKSKGLYRFLGLILMIFAVQGCTEIEEYSSVSVEGQSLLLLDRLESLYGSHEYLILPLSQDYSNIPGDPGNPLSEAKVQLGKLLFHETALGTEALLPEGLRTYSCASCHHSKAGFQSGLLQGIGEGGVGFGLGGEIRKASENYRPIDIDVQPIRTPTILNTAYQEVMLWNGQFGSTGVNEGTRPSWEPGTPKEANRLGFEGLETQAIAGMGVHRLSLDEKLILENPVYKELFDQAFSDIQQEERYSTLNAALAIAAYERTVLSNQAPFQRWLTGDYNAMNEEQVRGAELFFGKAECYSCHSGPGLNSMSFHALGMSDFPEDAIIGKVDEDIRKGRGGFTLKREDMFAFKTPTLYNLKDVKFLGHGGSFSSVESIVRYKNEAVPENSGVAKEHLSPLFYPLGLSDQEIALLTLFVEEALYDPNLERYVPDALPTGSCFPVADPLSKEHLNCD